MGELISTCVLEERWGGWNVWQLEEDGCVSDSDGGYAGSLTHIWVRLAFWFWQGVWGWEILSEGSRNHLLLREHFWRWTLLFNYWHPFQAQSQPRSLLNPPSLDLLYILDSEVTDRHLGGCVFKASLLIYSSQPRVQTCICLACWWISAAGDEHMLAASGWRTTFTCQG